MFPSNTKRLRFLSALLLFSFLLLTWDTFWPSKETRLVSTAQKLESQWLSNQLVLSQSKTRQNLLRMFSGLNRIGDEQRMERLSLIFLDDRFPAGELKTIVQIISASLEKWNDDSPLWKKALLQKGGALTAVSERGMVQSSPMPRIDVEVRYSGPQNNMNTVYLSGNWDENGSLASLRGWNPVHMQKVANKPTWSCQISVEPLSHSNYYHAVVRTAPWPQGRALGHTVFAATRNGQIVDVPPLFLSSSVASPTQVSRHSNKRIKLALLGIDGATWYALLPMMQSDRLPNFSKMAEQGSMIRLTSLGGDIGYTSLPCIHTALTGTLPYKHKTKKDFFGFSFREPVPRLWQILSGLGFRVCSVGMWGTFPVEKINGQMISEAYFLLRGLNQPEIQRAFLDPKTIAFSQMFEVSASDLKRLKKFSGFIQRYVSTTWPMGLEEELSKAVSAVTIKPGLELDEQARLLYDTQIIKVNRYLLDTAEMDVLISYLIGLDTVSHSYWHEFEPQVLKSFASSPNLSLAREVKQIKDSSRGKFFDAFTEVDNFLGTLLERSDNIVIFSDHGMTARTSGKPWPIINLDAQKILQSFKRARRSLPPSLFLVRFEDDGIIFSLADSTEDSRKQLTTFQEYLSSVEYASDRKKLLLISNLEEGGGEWGVKVALNPDLVTRDPFGALDSLNGPAEFADFVSLSFLEAEHAGNGVLLLKGPTVLPGKVLREAYMTDIVPTALYMLGQSPSTTMPGRPLFEAMDPTYVSQNPVRPVNKNHAGERPLISIARAIKWKSLINDLIKTRFQPK